MKKSLTIILIIAIVAILGIGGYIDYQKFLTSKTISQTSGWKIYTNTQYGFEIKYPTSFTMEMSEMPVDFYSTQNQDLGMLFISKSTKTGSGEFVTSGIPTKACVISEAELKTENWSYKGITMVNSINFYRYVSDGCDKSGVGCTYEDIYRIPHGSDCYEVSLVRTYLKTDLKAVNSLNSIPEIFGQMISTFKFTK